MRGAVAADEAGATRDATGSPAEADAKAAVAVDAPDAAVLAPIVVDAQAGREDAPLVERTFETPDDVAGFGEVIEAGPLWRGFETAGELLGQGVGAQLLRRGGREDFSTLTLRGAPSAQLTILLDGVSLGRASDSVVNLSELPFDTIERIEVIRGFAPAGLTPMSAAGVVNVVTKDPARATASASAGGGSFGSGRAGASAAGPLLGGTASAFASWRHTKGDFRYVDDNGTISKDEDDYVTRFRNNDSDAVDNLLRWRGDVGDASRLQLRNHVFYKEEGVPGVDHLDPPPARLETTRDIAVASLGGRDSRWSVEEAATWQRKSLTRYETASGTLDNRSDSTASTTTARWSRPLPGSHWLSGSSSYSWEGFDQEFPGGSRPGASADRSTLAVAVGDDWTVDPLATTLAFQVRHQQLWNDARGERSTGDHSTDPRIGLRWQPWGDLVAKANASTYFRPPNFDELYGADGFTVGNPNLVPEDGYAYDAGLEWSRTTADYGRIAASYAWFGSDVDDIILVRLTFNRTAQAFNTEKARIRGHELRLEWTGPMGLALSANATFQDAENRSAAAELAGKDLAGIAPEEGWARVSWTRGAWTLAWDVGVTGAHWADRENFQRLGTRVVHGLSLVVAEPWWKGLRLVLEAENLGDTLVPDQVGYPLPGRAFYATLSWSPPTAEEDADAH